ncbi:MAG: hypothetical protein OMM_00295 [Candidatus Magnetoglobus multicellularis str. Araruama]|uniref:AlgX/AlgJ SGNH hydrolase-like domain-containing protein n=1 Tax=Candidatus Magnetoglobus multicellularis str. Araruama TaxID=890399 RepID=A0A1V1PHT9_9BACT|nr:MAG: hypothetical protein OMM_00295 [Candidatus Magnetoglobus multicellularis str. Araruama]
MVKNYGVSSYSPIFYCLLWEQKVKFFKPDIVIMQLYSNDISSDESYKKIAVFSNDGQITAIPGPPQNKVTQFLRNFYLARFIRKIQLQLNWYFTHENLENKKVVSGYIEENPDLSQLSKDLILKCKQDVEKSGAEFYLFAIPSKYRLTQAELAKHSLQSHEFSDKVKLWANQQNINFIDMTDSFRKQSLTGHQLFFKKDIHLSKLGHQCVAKDLSKNIFTTKKR